MNLHSFIRSTLRRILTLWHESSHWARMSYAQEGEDLILYRLLETDALGFYVEVGSHHPFRFSNTYLFYRRGWCGICIDPLPNSKAMFNKWRPRDLALELGVTNSISSMKYYIFNEPALNTFDPLLAKKRDGLLGYKITAVKEIKTMPLASILKKHLPPNKKIDFLSVDVEGFDLQVLQSNDWRNYRPRYVVAECLNSDLLSIKEDPVVKYLTSLDYNPYAKTGNSVIFAE